MSAESAVERSVPAGAGSRSSQDEVERDLLKARALVEAAMFEHRRRLAAATLVELSDDGDAAGGTTRSLAASAREELIIVLAGAGWAAEVLPELGRALQNGVPVRVLCARETLRTAWGTRLVGRARSAGAQVRVAGVPLQELMLVDECAAAVRAGRQLMVIRAPAMLGALRGLFAGAWESASLAADRRPLEEAGWDGLHRQVLALLNAGHKDDAAARHLGLSVRTYRRHVAEIMRDMGAASRFQAGARAAELGLLAGGDGRRGQPSMPPSIWNTAPVM
ncbi:helix-turn-helix transcriptional regulator [Actinomadura spongiicola]|uniref:Helix-turn-helix transcriptional regulator n=1 Tax=Actinomadura spongiicola TaxID=2303421 RepID=A0A372GGU3_9ACTN|nr:LuxR family transcriptional regulator [Actinomadura spongiicola]RFS84319.1 helix-turn-helix transcriptional regulator [Actinomadura spongiicola]